MRFLLLLIFILFSSIVPGLPRKINIYVRIIRITPLIKEQKG